MKPDVAACDSAGTARRADLRNRGRALGGAGYMGAREDELQTTFDGQQRGGRAGQTGQSRSQQDEMRRRRNEGNGA